MAAPFADFSRADLITVSDTINIDGSDSTTGQNVKPCDAIWVGGAGIVKAVFQDGSTANFTTATNGTLLPIRAIRVFSGTTTATVMYAMYQV
jgi:phage gp37-like protein